MSKSAALTSNRTDEATFYLFDNVSRRFIGIADGVLLGRLEGEIQFPRDHLSSKKQCRFLISGYQVWIEDLGSTNRTKVNGVSIRPHTKRRLCLNDVIEFGVQRLILTNQFKHAPGNVQDRLRDKKLFIAKRSENGSLELAKTKWLGTSTGLSIDQLTFQKLRIKKILREQKQKHMKTVAREVKKPRVARFVARALIFTGFLFFLSLVMAEFQ